LIHYTIPWKAEQKALEEPGYVTPHTLDLHHVFASAKKSDYQLIEIYFSRLLNKL
jgi:hypothetical protein